MGSFIESLGANEIIYYPEKRPQVFDTRKNIALGAAAFVGLTALVIGILGILHSQGLLNAGFIGTIPPQVNYALIAIGVVCLVPDLIVLIILACKHAANSKAVCKVKHTMEEHLEADACRRSHGRQSDVDQQFKYMARFSDVPKKYMADSLKNPFVYPPGPTFYYVTTVENSEQIVHIFETQQQQDSFTTQLNDSQFKKY